MMVISTSRRRFDLVSQPRRIFEFEVCRRLTHALLQIGDDGLQIMPDKRRLSVSAKPASRSRDRARKRFRNVADVLLHRLRRDAVRLVVRHLLLAAPVGLGDGALHTARHRVGVEDDFPVHVARRAAIRLEEATFREEINPSLSRVQNGDKGTLGNIEPFSKKVDADQDVESSEPKIANDFRCAPACLHRSAGSAP